MTSTEPIPMKMPLSTDGMSDPNRIKAYCASSVPVDSLLSSICSEVWNSAFCKATYLSWYVVVSLDCRLPLALHERAAANLQVSGPHLNVNPTWAPRISWLVAEQRGEIWTYA